MNVLLVGVLAAAVGIAIGYYVFLSRANARTKHADSKADKLIKDAESKAKELALAAQDEALKVKQAGHTEDQERREQLKASEARIAKREEQLDKKETTLDSQRELLASEKTAVEELKSEIKEVKDRQLANLEKVAKLKTDQAKDVLLKMVEKEFAPEFERRIRAMEEGAKEEGERKAKHIIATAIQRFAGDQSSEMTVTSVHLPNEELKGRIIGKEGRNIQSFEKATGVDIIVDSDSPNTVVISGYNPVRRQVARIALERLISDGRVNPARIEEVVAKAEKEVNAISKKAGEDALFELGLTGVHPDLVKLLGTMKFRTSYGQNVLKHSVEVSFVCEMLGAELGVDAKTAKMAGLFHDIGKAVSHEVEGGHAMIGHDICLKYGISKEIAHAVGAHHEDLPIESTLDIITQVADAISGARPGARRESFELYIKRMTDLENVALSFDGVGKAYAIQAGREVRILVRPEEMDDLSSARLAKDVAGKIEKELTYPGQIKVNVIRETRATEHAK